MVELFAFVVNCEYDAWTYCAMRASNRHFHVEAIDAKRCTCDFSIRCKFKEGGDIINYVGILKEIDNQPFSIPKNVKHFFSFNFFESKLKNCPSRLSSTGFYIV
jgi:hypothetical protein